MTAAKVKSRRKPPFPNSILDRPALLRALDERGLTVKSMHIEAFYQALHRQHHPSLQKFVENYYNYESRTDQSSVPQYPLKNKVSARKNKNRKQLPRAFLQFLQENTDFVTLTSKIHQQKTSADGTTTKLIIELHDGQLVESVLMRYKSQQGAREGSRASLCVSSQCGCAMGCTFCATGTMGLSGNLTTGEILEQIVHADHILAREWQQHKENRDKNLDFVRNVVFMGMGEPLDNYTNVVHACRALIDRKRWNLAHGRVTVSTVGLVSQIRKLTKEVPEVSLALSLHAPNQEARQAIVPTAKHYPIQDLIDALDGHMMAYLSKRTYTTEERIKESSRRRAMIEYVMLEGETSSLECAHQLGKLCENRQLVVNLIPYNPTDVKDKLQCPTWEHMKEFQNIVSSYGTFCTIRRTMGADIASACGQLITKEEEKEAVVKDIEDMAADNTMRKKLMVEQSRIETTSEPKKDFDAGASHEVGLQRWIQPLAVATTVAATCFLVSSTLFLRQRRR